MYAEYINHYYSADVGIYNQDNLKDTTLNGDTSARLWWFQVCTEVAYFQVAPANDSVRSSMVDARSVFLICISFLLFLFDLR